jgi:hypothetical protein
MIAMSYTDDQTRTAFAMATHTGTEDTEIVGGIAEPEAKRRAECECSRDR